MLRWQAEVGFLCGLQSTWQEMHWMAKELAVLQKEVNDARCRAWLHSTEGRSTILAAHDEEEGGDGVEGKEAGAPPLAYEATRNSAGAAAGRKSSDAIAGFAGATNMSLMETALHSMRKQVDTLQAELKAKAEEAKEAQRVCEGAEAERDANAAEADDLRRRLEATEKECMEAAEEVEKLKAATQRMGASSQVCTTTERRLSRTATRGDYPVCFRSVRSASANCVWGAVCMPQTAPSTSPPARDNEAEENSEKLQRQLSDTQRRLAQSAAAVAAGGFELERLNGELSAARTASAEASAAHAQADTRAKRLEDEIASARHELLNCRSVIASRDAEIERLNGEVSSAMARFAASSVDASEVQKMRREVEAAQKALAESSGLVASKDAELQNLRTDLAAVEVGLAAAREEAGTAHEKLEAANSARAEATALAASKETELQNALEELAAMQKEVKAASDQRESERRDVQQQALAEANELRQQAEDAAAREAAARDEVSGLKAALATRQEELLAAQRAVIEAVEDGKRAATAETKVMEATALQAEVEKKAAAQQAELEKARSEMKVMQIAQTDARAAAEADKAAAAEARREADQLQQRLKEAEEALGAARAAGAKAQGDILAVKSELEAERRERKALGDAVQQVREAGACSIVIPAPQLPAPHTAAS